LKPAAEQISLVGACIVSAFGPLETENPARAQGRSAVGLMRRRACPEHVAPTILAQLPVL